MVDFTDTESLMAKGVDHFKTELAAIRTGRAVPALVENIVVNAYGGAQKLTVKELGTITAQDAQTLVIQPWDQTVIGEIRQGILSANVGLTPVIDNNLIRITVPSLTTERREEYVKLLGQKMEEARIFIRGVRQEKLKEIRGLFEGKEISEDEKFKAEEDLQKVTDKYIGQVEEMGERKEQEILRV
ncbi:MAG TPA: ribosome recycling factor [Clostridia bacterium]|nr:ribosome recycling factor [Clostridia bacterium]